MLFLVFAPGLLYNSEKLFTPIKLGKKDQSPGVVEFVLSPRALFRASPQPVLF